MKSLIRFLDFDGFVFQCKGFKKRFILPKKDTRHNIEILKGKGTEGR